MSSNVSEAIDEKPDLTAHRAKPRRQLTQFALLIPAGFISGLDGLSFSIAVASLLFAGSLSAGLHLAATAAIVTTILATLAVGIRSSIRTGVGCVQDIGVAILAVTLAATAGSITAPAETRVATAFCIIALATLMTGIVLLGTGHFKAGRIVRFFPLEVQAGFMAATGWLLLTGGIAMVTGADATLDAWLSLAQPHNMMLVIPAFLLGAIIFAALAVFRKPLTLVALLLLAIAVFHVWRVSQGLSLAEAAQAGFLPSVDTEAALALPFPGLIASIDWPTVAMALPAILMVAVLSLFGVLMNVSALELAGGQDVDVNRELKTAGTGNVIAAMAGGPPGYIDLTASTVCRKLGITIRGAAFAVATVELIGLFYSGQILAWVPTFVSAGLIIYFGFDLLKDWLVDTRKKFSLREWLVVVIIVLISALYSFILAIVAGFFIATILFAYSYANAPVIRHQTTLDRLPSTLDRTPADAAFLVGAGRGVQVVQLQGFLFFGTSEQVVSAVQRAAATGNANTLNAIIIDFSRVIDMDSASANAFRRIEKLAAAKRFGIWYCALNESVRIVMQRTGADLSGAGIIHVVDSLDQALEDAETMLIRRRLESNFAKAGQLGSQSPAELKALFAAMSRSEHPKGSTIIHAGAEADNVLYIESGRVLISRALSNGRRQRLRAMLAGALVGEIAFNLGGKRTADVVAEEDTVILSLSADQIRQWERESPELAIAFYRFMARQLADKVVTANRIAEHAAH